MSNIPTFHQDAATTTARNAQYAGTPLSDTDGNGDYNTYLGCNRAGSCAPGIGIAADVIDPKLSDWSVNDQEGNARTPQNGQHIGGDGLGAGNSDNEPIRSIIDQHGTPDFNDTAAYQEATQQAAPGAAIDLTSGAVNRGTQTVESGERIWAFIPVA